MLFDFTQAMKVSDARVLGSPHFFLSLRSRCIAAWHAMGPWTMAINLNPTDLDSSVVCQTARFSFLQAFCAVYMHWPVDVQERPHRQEDSPFGHVLGYMFKVCTRVHVSV